MVERFRRGPTVRHLQGLAPDLEVEESNSELGENETISGPRGIGTGSHDGMGPLMVSAAAALRPRIGGLLTCGMSCSTQWSARG